MISRTEAKAAEAKAFGEVRRAFRLLPTSVSVVRMSDGWGLLIGLPRNPGSLSSLRDIDGVPVELNVVGPAVLHG